MSKAVEGLEELKKNMKAFPLKLQRTVITAAVRGGAAEVAKMYKKNLPPGYFTLKKAIRVRKRRPKNRYEIRWTIHPERGNKAKFDAWYAHIVEDGAQPHEITTKLRRSLSIKGPSSFGNVDAAFARVHHPGVRPTKALTRAFRNQKQVLTAITKAGQRSFKRLKLKRGL